MEYFVPTITSPKPSGHQNLTGNRRLLKDLAAIIHSNIQEWNTIHIHGLSILKSIVAMKIDDSYPQGLQELCDDLEKDVDKLDKVVNNLKLSVHQIKATISLHKSSEKLFITWPANKFVETAEEIYEAYSDECELKRKILENIAHDHRDSWKMLHVASWVHQPMIPYNLNVTVEALLIETGHRVHSHNFRLITTEIYQLCESVSRHLAGKSAYILEVAIFHLKSTFQKNLLFSQVSLEFEPRSGILSLFKLFFYRRRKD